MPSADERRTMYYLLSILLNGDLIVKGQSDVHSELQPYVVSSPEISIYSLGPRHPLLLQP